MIKHSLLRLLPVCAALAAAACGPKQPSSGNGRQYYMALNCRNCHRIGAEGGPSGSDLTYVGFRYHRAWLDVWMKNPHAWKPTAQMPNPNLSASARAALVDYLSTLKGQDYPIKPWNDPALKDDSIARGHVLFARTGCITCHGRGGTGGFPNNNVRGGLIPALSGVSKTYTKEELIKKITRGSQPLKADAAAPDPFISMPAWGQTLSPAEIEAVADYLLTLKPTTVDPKSDW